MRTATDRYWAREAPIEAQAGRLLVRWYRGAGKLQLYRIAENARGQRYPRWRLTVDVGMELAGPVAALLREILGNRSTTGIGEDRGAPAGGAAPGLAIPESPRSGVVSGAAAGGASGGASDIPDLRAPGSSSPIETSGRGAPAPSAAPKSSGIRGDR